MSRNESVVSRKRVIDWLRRYCGVLILYILATWLTDAHSMGDTRIYATDILRGSKYDFWEFGHVLWRPLGWLLSQLFHPLTRLVIGDDPHLNVMVTLMAVSWVTGLISVLFVCALARKFCGREWVVYLVTIAFLFSNAFLNYAQTGHSYVSGLSLLLLGLHESLKDVETTPYSPFASLLAGLALALAVGMWFPYVLSVPAILASPLFLVDFNKSQLRRVWLTSLVFALASALVYVSVLIHLGIHNVDGLKAWITAAGHGIDGMRGIPRMIFGFARSLINMGNDGRLFKRYVVHDPLNRVSLFDLFRFSFWKLVLFYLFFLAILINLLFSKLGKRTLALLVLSAAPLVVFALFLFESGTIDRYLPLYPLIFVSFAISLCSDNSRGWTKVIALAFVAVATFSNVGAMSTSLNRKQEMVAARIKDLQPLLRPGSRVITIIEQDEVYEFNANFPFNPLNRSARLDADNLIDPGNISVLKWRQIFATKTLALWDKGGEVWITKRVLYQSPRPEWNWVEGDDPRVFWRDIPAFFAQIEMGQSVGGEDGFVLISPSPQNKQLLSAVAQRTNVEK